MADRMLAHCYHCSRPIMASDTYEDDGGLFFHSACVDAASTLAAGPAARNHYHVATYVYAKPDPKWGQHGSPYHTQEAAQRGCSDLGRARGQNVTSWRCISPDCLYA